MVSADRLWDPLEPQPHDPDVKALLRMAVVWNVPVACDRSSDFMISSPLMDCKCERIVPDYEEYRGRPMAGTEPTAVERAAELENERLLAIARPPWAKR